MTEMQPSSSSNAMSIRPASSGGIDLRQQLHILWRRRRLVMGTVIGVVGLSWGILMQATPIFAGNASVMIDTRKTRYLDLKEVITTSLPQLTTVLSEVEVIRSRNVAQRVADSQNLYADPEFNAALRPKGMGIRTLLKEAVSFFLPDRTPVVDDAEKERRMRTQVVTALTNSISANPVPQSLVIKISVLSKDADKAALLTNAVAEQYVLDQLNSKFETTRNASNWLNQRLEDLRASVLESERAVATFKGSSGLIESRGVLPTHQQLAELNSQLINVQATRSEMEAKVARLETLMRSSRGAEAAEEMIDSPLIQRLRESETTLMREASEMSTRYGDAHPKMIKAKAELTELRAKINIEMSKVGQTVHNDFNVVRAREAALLERIRRLEGTVVQQNKAEVRLHELEREAQANRMLYENFLNRFKETTEQEQVQQPDARIISSAVRPVSAAYPRKGLILGAVTICGLLFGTVLAFVLERLDNTFRNREDLENATGLPAIGMIPFVNKKPVAKYMLDRPASAFAESLRGIWVNLSHSDAANAPKIIAVTSSFPGEGKSMTALCLARTIAALGHRVVLVDCDLRRSAVGKLLDITPDKCLDDILEGRIQLKQALITDPVSSLNILPSRNVVRPPLDILGSTAMVDLIQNLRQSFDLVILDCPPVMPVSEVQILGRLADTTVFCVLWDKTPREAVSGALRQLRDVQVDIAGAVLTQVNMKKHARYGYGDVGHYYGRYEAYYKN